MLEENFVTSLIKADGHFIAFLNRPIAGALALVTVAVWVSPLMIWWWRRRARRASARRLG